MIGRRGLMQKIGTMGALLFWNYQLKAASIGFLPSFIGPNDILQGREKRYPLSKRQLSNLKQLLVALNKLSEKYRKPLKVSSGYRPRRHNQRVGGAEDSAHLYCMAVDFLDPKRELARWCMDNLDVLKKCGLWMEHPKYTPGWVHLDIRPRNIRVFDP